jgi:hypothetical protein
MSRYAEYVNTDGMSSKFYVAGDHLKAHDSPCDKSRASQVIGMRNAMTQWQ